MNPRMGTTGADLSLLISHSFSPIVGLFFIYRKLSRVRACVSVAKYAKSRG